MTDVDYKIVMKLLVDRLKSVIDIIVGRHQSCGINGRSIVMNIHVARSILECCDSLDRKVALLQVDLEKAFDRVLHVILFSILKHVNLGSVLCDGVRMACESCATSLVVNKHVSERIRIFVVSKAGLSTFSVNFLNFF